MFVDLEDIPRYEKVLGDPSANIADRVDSLFSLKAFKEPESVDAIIRSFWKEKNSELLKHEICYCLGQMNKSPEHNSRIQKFLEQIIDEKAGFEDIVIHEAFEALGNLGQEGTVAPLKRYLENSKTCTMVQETCFLVDKLLEWNKATDNGKLEKYDKSRLQFKSNDPAPPYNIYEGSEEELRKNTDIERLHSILINKDSTGKKLDYDLFERYRAIFTLREINTKESTLKICDTLTKENMDTCGSLMKHEIAYVLAQLEDHNEVAVPFLMESVLNDEEAPIVRHEALIAVGEMIDDKQKLEHLLKHKESIVNESAQVAIRNIENRQAYEKMMAERGLEE